MSKSALMGHPANNQDDVWIIRGGLRIFGIPDSEFNEKTSVIPALMPPNAPHDSRQNRLIIGAIICIILTILITGTRLCLRLFKRGLQWGMDDWTIILAMLGVVAFFGLNIAIATEGAAGKHIYDTTYAEFNMHVSIIFNIQMFYYAILALIKVSIVLFNRRLTGLTSRSWMIFHNTLLVLLLGYILGSILATYFVIWPHPENFSVIAIGQMATAPTFHPNKPVVTALSVIHMVFDLVLLAVPLIILYQIQMELSKKIRLGLLFSIGAVSTLGAVMRVVKQNQGSHSKDIIYGLIDSVPWSIIDIFFGIVVASLPTLNALIPMSWSESRYAKTKSSGRSSLPESESRAKIARVQEHELRPVGPRGLTEDVEARSGKEGRGHSVLPDWNTYQAETKSAV